MKTLRQWKWVLLEKLNDILPRLDLPGFTREQAKREYLRAVEVPVSYALP